MTRLFAAMLFVLASQTAHAFPSYANGTGFRGAELMSEDERKAHVAQLLDMKTFDQCESYMSAHEDELQKRAAEKHVTLPPKGGILFDGDPCKVMRFMGRVK